MPEKTAFSKQALLPRWCVLDLAKWLENQEKSFNMLTTCVNLTKRVQARSPTEARLPVLVGGAGG